MRNFQTLDQTHVDHETGILFLTESGETAMPARLSMRREGTYLAISTSYGPIEIAMRPKYEDVTRLLARLRPITGLQTTRQVGTGQAYLGLGLQGDGRLVIRPTIVADATGHLSFNLLLLPSTKQVLFDWLGITPVEHS